MSLSSVVRRGSAVVAVLAATAALSACSSGGYSGDSDYVSPIAVGAAPHPSVPSASGGATGRRPLLPPVPGDQSSKGLPPVSTASLLPPTVR